MTGYVLFFIHLLLSLFVRLQATWDNIVMQLWGGVSGGVCSWRGSATQDAQLRRLSARIDRVPAHLGLVVVEERLVLPDLAKVVVWAAALGVSFVTVYDYKGRHGILASSSAV